MDNKMVSSLVDQERELNLEARSAAPSMFFIEKVQLVTRNDGLFLVRLFSEAPLSSKEEFRFIGTKSFLRQFAELAIKQLDSAKSDSNENESVLSKGKRVDGSKKKADKKN